MKKFNENEAKDKLIAYYGDEYAIRRTRKRIAISNIKTCIISIPVVFLIALFFFYNCRI